MKTTAIILCAGSGARVGLGYNKLLYNNGLGTVLDRTITAIESHPRVDDIILTHSKEDEPAIKEIVSARGYTAVLGGDTRFGSVHNALRAIKGSDIVLIHDGARPFVTHDIIDRCIESAVTFGSAVACVPVADTIKAVSDGAISATIPRHNLYAAQTPQCFGYRMIKDAYDAGAKSGDLSGFTDDASVLEAIGISPKLVMGGYDNTKITSNSDLARLPSRLKMGLGYDVHRFVSGRPLILGGVVIPYQYGLLGHSDADVLTHAVMDAILSAADLPDIGVLFPDTDDKYKGADSVELLRAVMDKVPRNVSIVNISCVVMALKPKLMGYIQSIRERLAGVMGIDKGQINISATTTEGLGITATADEAGGMSASCNVLVRLG